MALVQPPQQPRQLPPVVRDSVMLAIGAGGIAYQQWTGQVSELLLGVYVLLLGGPAVGGLWSMLRGVPTTGPPSQSPEPPSPSGPSTGSPPASGEADR